MEWIPEEQVAEDGSVRKAVAKQGQSVLSFFCVFGGAVSAYFRIQKKALILRVKCSILLYALKKSKDYIRQRGVAQFGSAPDWGSGGRRFKSCLSDHQKILGISSVPRIFHFDGNP